MHPGLCLLTLLLLSESSSSNSDGLEVGSLYFPMPNVTFILKDTSKGLLERPIITFQALNIHTKSTSNKIFEDQHGIYTIENTTRPQWFTIDYQGRINLTNTAIKFLSDHSESHDAYVKIRVNNHNDKAFAELRLSVQLTEGLQCDKLDHKQYCFWDSVKYQLYEESEYETIGQIGRGAPSQCSHFIYHYKLNKGHDIFEVNETFPGAPLRSEGKIDRERLRTNDPSNITNPVKIEITCKVFKKINNSSKIHDEIVHNLSVYILDKDDNLPILEKKPQKHINEPQNLSSDHWWTVTSLEDPDTPIVNRFDLNASDPENLYEYKLEYNPSTDNLIHSKSQLNIRMKVKRNGSLSFDPYPVDWIVTDHNYSGFQKTNKITGRFFLHRNFSPRYPNSVIVHRLTSGLHSRVATITNYGTDLLAKTNYSFALEGNHSAAFAITAKQGIIYVANEKALLNITSHYIQLIVFWAPMDSMSNKTNWNSSKILVNLSDDDTSCYNSQRLKYCQSITKEKICRETCGISVETSNNGICQWFVKDNQFSTCTVDSSTCPDSVCDALEELNKPIICPLDCLSTSFVLNYSNDSICSCKDTKTCTCISHGLHHVDTPTYRDINTSRCGVTCWTGIGLIIVLAFSLFWIIRRIAIWKRFNNKALTVGTSSVATTTDPMHTLVIDYTSTDEMARGLMTDFLGPKWEFPREKLSIEENLGEGEFGIVMRATARDIAGNSGLTTVAVKTIKPGATSSELRDLLSEYQLLKDVGHPHVIRLMGASTTPPGPVYLILEYCSHGSLSSYLRKIRSQGEAGLLTNQAMCSPKEIISFAWQIAKGMTYLSDIKLVHRDLAARNVLLAEGKVCKISDFGLTRDIYVDDTYLKSSKGRVPVKWMAIESLTDHIYTCRSDVWSFGIVLWELVTLGASPYPGLAIGNLYNFLKAGYRMDKPINCSHQLYEIMRNCWKSNPHCRPKFRELTAIFERMLEEGNDYLNLNPNIVFNKTYFDTDGNSGESFASTSGHVVTSYQLIEGERETPNDSQRLLKNPIPVEDYLSPIRLPKPSTSMTLP